MLWGALSNLHQKNDDTMRTLYLFIVILTGVTIANQVEIFLLIRLKRGNLSQD